jgi:hypothetical protein
LITLGLVFFTINNGNADIFQDTDILSPFLSVI